MMPFRIPRDYQTLTCWQADSTHEELVAYQAWLRKELHCVEAAVQMTTPAQPAGKPKREAPTPPEPK